MSLPLTIPSPDHAVWQLGPVPVRAYALCLVAGILVAIVLGERRWTARGGSRGEVADLALWAVPAGLVGGRLGHVLVEHQRYFPDHAWGIVQVWRGGFDLTGAALGGLLGLWLGARRLRPRVPDLLDALAPPVLVGLAVGGCGAWFGQEQYGSRTDLPWRLEIDQHDLAGNVIGHTYHHPLFLYDALCCLALAALLVVAERRDGPVVLRRPGLVAAAAVAGYLLARLVVRVLGG